MEHAVLIPQKLYEFSLTELTVEEPCTTQSEGGSSQVDPGFYDQGGLWLWFDFFSPLHHVEFSLPGDAIKERKMGAIFCFKMAILNWKEWEKDKDMWGS